MSNQLFDRYFISAAMGAVFSDTGRVQGMLDFEAALARAEARVGLIPHGAVAEIEAACRAERYDFAELAEAIVLAGNSAIPLVKALGRQVAAADPQAERYVHLGATSQDAMDTGLVLQLRQACALLDADLAQLAEALALQAERHADSVLPGRTWLQHATPVTLGMKLAGSLGAITRHRQRLAELKPRLLVLQFGGAAGTLAALGEQGWAVSEALAEELALALPDQPWHTQRDRLVEFASLLGLIAGSLGLWHAEWQTLPDLCGLVSGALQQALLAVPGLEVDSARMRSNLDMTRGLLLAEAVSIALAQRIGRDKAHHLIEQCCRQAIAEQRHLREVLGEHAEVGAQLSAAELDRLLDPTHYLGQAQRWVARALAEHRAMNS